MASASTLSSSLFNLHIPPNISFSTFRIRHNLHPRMVCTSKLPPVAVICHFSKDNHNFHEEPRKWQVILTTTLAAAIVFSGMSAQAELNKYEAETRGEFGIGSAAQFGSADLRKTVHANENFRRANFTSADMRESDFSGSTFNGAYLEKAVAYRTNFSGADLSDTLMDRMVLNEANFTNAILVRSVLTRSDLGGAIIEGADFSDAVLDLPQKQRRRLLNFDTAQGWIPACLI
ncbi:thylakoid lumenal protein TL20.3, chloroplastic isoform X2 [Amborella trichopoda]|uniref:thylakoid lumenal protein TL20.3, chloroplastic isoform X2 n=1 Tax=Amborella trichopoda TaxID=13333 RepID=UPI0009C0E8DC|nr:thylakoid lumenal protein TL20.3, chloroplastic isoform X2 [Amborella trichopoda]|eukprot:XP_020524093.1 thylakoid lumenal protein TL20.3, chloroplastic isoform X2 [Amborella trichopoda]